jgi:soluble lytic murein transglycosylase-like protein
MSRVPAPFRPTPRVAAFFLLVMLGASQPARADILVRDEGEQGLVLENVAAGGEAFGSMPASRRATRVPAPALSPRPQLAARRQLFAPLVQAAARTHGLPEALLQAVIEVESGFDPAAVSPKGAVGLMQLMPDTARALRVRDARDPAANLDGGARYLKDLLARHGNDLVLALAAYNAGPAAVQRSGGVPRFAETQAYVPRVIARYHRLQSGAD